MLKFGDFGDKLFKVLQDIQEVSLKDQNFLRIKFLEARQKSSKFLKLLPLKILGYGHARVLCKLESCTLIVAFDKSNSKINVSQCVLREISTFTVITQVQVNHNSILDSKKV